MKRFNKRALDLIRDNSELWAKVSDAIGVKPASLSTTLARNGNKLNQFSVVKLVADFAGEEDLESLLEDVPETAEEQS